MYKPDLSLYFWVHWRKTPYLTAAFGLQYIHKEKTNGLIYLKFKVCKKQCKLIY